AQVIDEIARGLRRASDGSEHGKARARRACHEIASNADPLLWPAAPPCAVTRPQAFRTAPRLRRREPNGTGERCWNRERFRAPAGGRGKMEGMQARIPDASRCAGCLGSGETPTDYGMVDCPDCGGAGFLPSRNVL